MSMPWSELLRCFIMVNVRGPHQGYKERLFSSNCLQRHVVIKDLNYVVSSFVFPCRHVLEQHMTEVMSYTGESANDWDPYEYIPLGSSSWHGCNSGIRFTSAIGWYNGLERNCGCLTSVLRAIQAWQLRVRWLPRQKCAVCMD